MVSGVGVSVDACVASAVGVGTSATVGSGVVEASEVGSGPGAPTVDEGVAVGCTVGSSVAVIATVGTGSRNGVAVGVGVCPNGRGVGIGAKMSGEIVGGMLPSAGPVQATPAASTTGMLAIKIRFTINFIPRRLS